MQTLEYIARIERMEWRGEEVWKVLESSGLLTEFPVTTARERRGRKLFWPRSRRS